MRALLPLVLERTKRDLKNAVCIIIKVLSVATSDTTLHFNAFTVDLTPWVRSALVCGIEWEAGTLSGKIGSP